MTTTATVRADLTSFGQGIMSCGSVSSSAVNATVLDMIGACHCARSTLLAFAIGYLENFGNYVSQVFHYHGDPIPQDCHPGHPTNTTGTAWKLFKNGALDQNQAINLNRVKSSDDLLFKYIKTSNNTVV